MRRISLLARIAALSSLGWLGCTSETHSTTDAGTHPASGGSGGQNGGAGGISGAGTGGQAATGGAGTGGDGPDAGIDNPDTGNGSDSAAETERGGAPPAGGKGPFTCNHVLGLFTTSQWYFEGGFEQAVGDANWQIMWQKYSYITLWADPNSDRWKLKVQSPCAMNSDKPDRVVLVAHAEMTDEKRWEALLTQAVATVQMKFPSVKEIDILTMSRAPNNMLCKNNNDVWTIVAPTVDQAIQNVADQSGGLVVVGPKYYVPDCATSYSFPNDTDFTKSADTFIAQTLAAYYKAHP